MYVYIYTYIYIYIYIYRRKPVRQEGPNTKYQTGRSGNPVIR